VICEACCGRNHKSTRDPKKELQSQFQVGEVPHLHLESLHMGCKGVEQCVQLTKCMLWQKEFAPQDIVLEYQLELFPFVQRLGMFWANYVCL